MKSKAILETFLGSVFILIFLSAVIPTLAQSTGDVSSPQQQEAGNATEAKPAVPADAGKVIQTKSFTLEGENVWVETGISLEPGQRFVVSSEGSLRYTDAKADNGPEIGRASCRE